MVTIEQIKEDIKAGKTKNIYWSCFTLWWTHLESDVEAATAIGRRVKEKAVQNVMNSPNIPDEKKNMIRNAHNVGNAANLPLDPTGSPLMMTEEVLAFIEGAERNPSMYGQHGIKAFMKAHHQNSGGLCYQTWSYYNLMVDVN